MKLKVRNTLLSGKELQDCYNTIIVESFSEDGFYDPFINKVVKNIAFLNSFCTPDSFDGVEDITSFALSIDPGHVLLDAENDELRSQLYRQWDNIMDCASEAINELKSQKQNEKVQELFDVISNLFKSANGLVEQLDVEQLNKNIKKFTPNALVKEQNKSEEKKAQNIIPIKS